MAPKTMGCFDILSFTERFLKGNIEVMISSLLIICKSLGINIMFIVLFLSGGE
jgi:hypothetical protein